MTKKNLMMRIASVLLIAVVLTTSVIGGTLAKFTSSYEGTAIATVATWAFEITSDASTLEEEIKVDLGTTVKDEENVVFGVIAPGTKGEFIINVANIGQVTAKCTATLSAINKEIKDFSFEVSDPTVIEAGKDANVTVSWEWPFNENEIENDFAGDTDFEATITIVLDQVD